MPALISSNPIRLRSIEGVARSTEQANAETSLLWCGHEWPVAGNEENLEELA